MNLLKQTLYRMIIDCLEEWNESAVRKIPLERGEDAPLYNKEGYLDSVGLVSVLISIEQCIEDEWNESIELTNNANALSLQDSPYKSVGNLLSFLMQKFEARKVGH